MVNRRCVVASLLQEARAQDSPVNSPHLLDSNTNVVGRVPTSANPKLCHSLSLLCCTLCVFSLVSAAGWIVMQNCAWVDHLSLYSMPTWVKFLHQRGYFKTFVLDKCQE